MKRSIVFSLCAFAALSAGPLGAQSQSENQVNGTQFVIDPTLAESGRSVFRARGCSGCHTIGKGDLSAPDLGGLFERRTVDWIKQWLRDPTTMLERDEIAKALFKQWGMRMPNLKLSDTEIAALMHHIAAETRAARQENASTR